MEDYMYIAAVVGFVFGILQIILFVKLWIMTNDIRKIRNKYLGEENVYSQSEIIEQSSPTNNNPIRIVGVLFTIASLMGVYYMPIWTGSVVIFVDIVLLIYAFTRK